MSRINLLPWREELRKVRNRIFFTISGGIVVLGMIVVFIIHLVLSYRIQVENANVAYLNKELQSINNEISQIQGLQENKENLLSRMRIIQALQEDRSSIVKLLDLIPRVVPDSVYLISLTRSEPEALAASNPNGPAQPAAGVGAEETALEKIKKGIGMNEDQKKTEVIKKEYHVQILGVAQTNSGISNFMKNLQEIHWISDIKYSEVSINKTGEGLNFKLEFSQKIGGVDAVNKKPESTGLKKKGEDSEAQNKIKPKQGEG